ncbi:amino acid/polyamine/organocation transporter, APC superfamily [Halorientalis persicus]|jgi:APA family basic amino acid/polyamine antiporter|uniref:Amino acid/polyamine/organocation transporter, APC superfamily n=1 Tax=Halorientalis persicus TaxID=1367881 RepID=A0A1H8PJ76_9EURY|nr:APC family permease [Halorientalis persicus]SEO42079.1 amino acid/polyamine/organocation transporter, APC superfamily [Halorientalis persicus]
MDDTQTDGEFSRVLSKRDVFVLAFGAMVGWGWIIQSGYWIDEGGVMGSVVAFVLGAFMVAVVGLIYGELASAMPFVGGEHVYSMRALGPIGSFVCTWSLILGYVGVVVFEVVAFPSALAYVVPGFNALPLWSIAGQTVYGTWVLVGSVGAVVMTYLNYRGVQPAAQFQTILTLVIGLAGITLAIGAVANGHTTSTPPFADSGLAGVLTVAIMTPFMFVGFDVIPQAAGEADVSERVLGLLIVVSVSVAALFYILVIWASGRALPGAVLVESSLPAAAAMEALFSSALIGKIMALAGIAGILTSWNSFLLGGSRAIYALAESGMLPETLATVNETTDTPSRALALIGGLSVFAPLFGEQMLVWIVNAGGFGIVVAWVMVVVSFLVLRVREPEMDRPLKLPAGKAVGVLGLALTLVFTGMYLPGAPSALQWPFEWGIVVLWVLLGAGLAVLSRRSGNQTHVDAHGFDGD